MKVFGMGKSALVRLLVLGLILGAAQGYAASKSSILLVVKDKSEKSDDRQEDIKENSNGNETTTTTETETEVCTLTVRIENKGDLSPECQLEWYFISEKVSGKEENLKIFSCGRKDISLPVGEVVEEVITSAPFVLSTVSQDTGNADDVELGDTYEGFVVLITSKGKILSEKSSSSRYLKPEWRDKCSRAMRTTMM